MRVRTSSVQLVVVLLILVGFVAPCAGAGPSDEVRNLFDEGNESFNMAIERLDQSPTDAEIGLRDAIDSWERIVVQHDIENGWLYYNIGNAYLLMDDVGRAIVNYRRAQRLIGDEPELVANLNEARRRMKTRIEEASDRRIADVLLFWQGDLPARTQFDLFVFLFVIAWSWALVRLAPAFRSWPRWPGAVAGGAAIVLLGALAWTERDRAETPMAVVVESFEGRKGPSTSGYERSFLEPLHPGVEVRLLEERGDEWVLIRLADGRTTWAPRRAIETIQRSLIPPQ